MKKVATGLFSLGLLLGAAACGGVDKEGTADELITGLKDAGLTMDADQEACVRESIDSRSDADLKDLDKMMGDNQMDEPAVTEFMDEVLSCAGLGG